MPQAAFREDGQCAADLAEDGRQRRDVVGEQSEVGERAVPQVLGYLVGAVLPAAGLEDLGNVVAVERPERVVDLGIGLAAVGV